MKKIITTALIAAMLTASLAGCSGSSDPGSSDNSGNSSSGGTSSTDGGTSSTDGGTSSEDNSSAPETEGKTPVDRLQAVFSSFSVFDVNSVDGFMSMMVAGPDADAIKAVFPDSTDPEKPLHCVFSVEDSEIVAQAIELTQLDFEDCEDYILALPTKSASLKRFVIAKPKAGKEEAVKSALSAYADDQKTARPTEYPSWEEERAGTYFGETDDGCYYVVVAAEGAEMGSAIENA